MKEIVSLGNSTPVPPRMNELTREVLDASRSACSSANPPMMYRQWSSSSRVRFVSAPRYCTPTFHAGELMFSALKELVL